MKEPAVISTDFLISNYNIMAHELDLSNQGLKEVPNFEKYLTGSYQYDVWSISLLKNELTEVNSEDFAYFPNLKDLKLPYNKLEEVTLTDLPLENLELHKNALTSVDLSGLKKLASVNLGYNKLSSMNDIQVGTGMVVLELQHNQLKDIT